MNLSTLNPNELVGPSGRNVQSAYFDGTGDNLSISSATGLCDFATGQAFTFQVWFYRLGTGSMLFIQGGSNTFQVFVGSSTGGWGYGKAGVADVLTGAGAAPIGAWTHCTICRDTSNRSRIWVNGVSVASSTSDTYSYNTAATYIGSNNTSSSSFVQGYLSDMRILKGQALYDPTSAASIEVPTAPLTPIANTSFLLGFSEYRFIDQSPNNFTITRNGDTTQSTFGPYGDNWSNYFDGVDDYLRIAPGAAFAFGTGDFTVELWVYPTKESAQIGGGIRMIDARNASQTTAWLIGTNLNASAGNAFQLGWFDGSVDFISTGTLTKDGWNHVVYTRSGTTGSLFLNGARVGTRTDSVNYSISPTQSTIGARFDGTLYATTGYISNIRTVKGTAVYDPTKTTLTVPTAPLPVIPNTSLLTCQSNRFLDSSPNNFAITRNGNVSVQPYVPFPANWSNYFDGTGDFLTTPDNAAFDFGTGDFTIEAWVFIAGNSALNGSSARDAAIFGCYPTSGAISNSYSFAISGSSTTTGTGLVFESYQSGTRYGLNVTTTLAQNTWHHVAVSRSGTTTKIFLNGSEVLSGTLGNQTVNSAYTMTIGRIAYTSYEGFFNGYISNLRVVKGTAVYTAAFTPSTTPLTAITNTSLLTCQSSSFTDFSPNNFTITANGDVSARFYGPFAGPVPEPVVDVYTTTGVANTWIKRPGAKAVQMIAIGAGGGGGGGGASATANFRSGGGGGGGGANGQIIYTADQLPATLYIRVGASGTGGASNGAGGAGGNSTIAAADPITTSTSVYCMGGGGGGGKAGGLLTQGSGGGGGGTAGAGTTGTGTSAVAGGLPSLGTGDALTGGGGRGGYSNSTAPGRAEWGGGGGGCSRQEGDFKFAGAGSLYGGGGGGCGATLGAAGGVAVGTVGGGSGTYALGVSPPGGTTPSTAANGGAGANGSGLYVAGSGGGGGYGNNSGTGYTGGAGGFPGGGGGGGGASSSTGGTGGVGGAGRVVLITFF